MKRVFLLILTIVCTINIHAQSGMTDSQVMDFVVKEQKRGTSQQQIVTKLMQSGVDISQIRRVRNMYERMKTGSGSATGSTEASSDRTRRNNTEYDQRKSKSEIANETRQYAAGEQMAAGTYSTNRIQGQNSRGNTYDEYDENFLAMQDEINDWMPQDTATMYKQLIERLSRDKKKVFGRDIFNKRNLSFEPNMNIATPKNYVLGPGDAVYIDVYGASQKSFECTVSPDGYINVEGFGPIQVSGLTSAQANSRVRSQLGQRYSSSQIKLTVGQTRTISISVMGEVNVPGTYTLSAFATVFHALYMAGGINSLGTMRNIKVFRNGRLISTVDIYDYILN